MNNYVKTYMGRKRSHGLPLAVMIIYILTALTILFHILSAFLPSLADGINMTASAAIRFVLAHLTNLIPFSLAEMLILIIPIIIIIFVRYAVKHFGDSWRSVLVYTASIFSVACVFYMLFFWAYGVGYGASPLSEKLELERQKISVEELKETALILSDNASDAASEVIFREKNFSVMPYGTDELSRRLCSSYDSFTEKHGFVSKLDSRLKPIMLSDAMSYTHITGIYSYFTGEANINMSFPDYTIPFTAAHEMAHQRGIAREDEANFVAFLVCLESDDPYIRYSAYLNMLEYVTNALYRADKDAYKAVMSTLNPNIYYEMVAYSKFFDKYRDSVASNVSGAINDTYLKLNGTEGEKSYGMVVDLAVAYYKKQN